MKHGAIKALIWTAACVGLFLAVYLADRQRAAAQDGIGGVCSWPLTGHVYFGQSCGVATNTVRGTELGNITIGDGFTLTINSGALVCWNTGYSVSPVGPIVRGTNASLNKRSGIYHYDGDSDGWTSNFNGQCLNSSPGSGWVLRRNLQPYAMSALDCNDGAHSPANDCGGGGTSIEVGLEVGVSNQLEGPAGKWEDIQWFLKKEDLQYIEPEQCMNQYCGQTTQATIAAIDAAVERGLRYMFDLSSFLQDTWSNEFNRFYLLKLIDDIKPRQDVQSFLGRYLPIYEEQLEATNPDLYDRYKGSLGYIKPRTDLQASLAYSLLKEQPPAENTLTTQNMRLSMIARYCRDIFASYDEAEQAMILRYLGETALEGRVKGDNYYLTTHALLYLDEMYRLGCIADKGVVDKAARATVYRNKLMTKFTDWHVEGPAALVLTGRTSMFRPGWVPKILASQEEDGGWPVVEGMYLKYPNPTKSHTHSTGLAIIALLGYKQHILAGGEIGDQSWMTYPLEIERKAIYSYGYDTESAVTGAIKWAKQLFAGFWR